MDSIIQEAFTHVAAVTCNSQNFLGLVPWYHYLTIQAVNGGCEVQNFQLLGSHSSILLILLAIVDDLLRITGLLSVLYIIYAGIRYSMSQGSPDEVAKSQTTIINGLAGLAISIIAIRSVSFIANQFNGGGGGTTAAGISLASLPNPANIASGGIIPTLLTVVFGIAGAIAFLFLVVGGYNYISSQGDPQRVNKAKNTIMYALIGLVVAISAQSISSLLVGKL